MKLLDAYLKRYIEKSGYTYEDMAAWLPIQAAKYMGVGMPKECERIFLDIIRGGSRLH
jgi:hypothetical protein